MILRPINAIRILLVCFIPAALRQRGGLDHITGLAMAVCVSVNLAKVVLTFARLKTLEETCQNR
jgi:hypothetical protein